METSCEHNANMASPYEVDMANLLTYIAASNVVTQFFLNAQTICFAHDSVFPHEHI